MKSDLLDELIPAASVGNQSTDKTKAFQSTLVPSPPTSNLILDKEAGVVPPKVSEKTRSKGSHSWKRADISTAFPNLVFRGVVTWIDCKGELYFHDQKWAKQLTEMRKKLREVYRGSQPNESDLNCRTGHACIVKYCFFIYLFC